MKNGSNVIKGAAIGIIANMLSNQITFGSWQMENVFVGLIVGAIMGYILGD